MDHGKDYYRLIDITHAADYITGLLESPARPLQGLAGGPFRPLRSAGPGLSLFVSLLTHSGWDSPDLGRSSLRSW
ncbi:hypothetical protein KTAU_29920 [Thermogemmatispora aurantia]|nr:hypothetical protein KTAU_29920 [Thermogemmatispora aurantia]